ncbi:Hsp20/alpha crystallin family protein [Clostridium vincentii]|uniref:18 kDa heat shock protein n=1 Tax=Clostridium vincentii TaxID=52704 RepID=A0A2T0BE58_9CLOT|nr:Hsp20/alpha crystallin family protein [Clostridium vincentii]PRR82180.1 18 kDa heat shock protein [Clostridium vincentii]
MFGRIPFNYNQNSYMNILEDDFLTSIVNEILGNNLINDLVNEMSQEEDFNVELKDYGEYYLIKGYLPGLGPKDVSIDFEKNKAILTIKRKQVYSNGQNYRMTVVQTGGDLIKTFYIEDVDVINLKATFNDSLLLLTIPKVKKIEAKKDDVTIIDVDSYRVE